MTAGLLVALLGLVLLITSWVVIKLSKKDYKYVVATVLSATSFGLFLANTIHGILK